IAGRKPRHTILLCIHSHTAELHDLERPSILCQAHLLVKCGPAIRLDGNGSYQEDRTGDHQCSERQHNVHRTLDEQIFRVYHITPDPQHGQMEHMHRIRAAHDHVADSRDHKHTDIPCHTVLQNNVPVVTV